MKSEIIIPVKAEMDPVIKKLTGIILIECNEECCYFNDGRYGCQLKEIGINKDGQCIYQQKRID